MHPICLLFAFRNSQFAMNDIAIRVDHLSKLYRIGKSPHLFQRFNVPTFERSNDGYIWALRDVSLEVKRGEVVGIPSLPLRTGIGRNGAGKSTLLKILSRITEPTSGRGRR
jgi:lipopolysaccharide transport system ATP-binding protein